MPSLKGQVRAPDCLYSLLHIKWKWKQFPRATPHTPHPTRSQGLQVRTSSRKDRGKAGWALLASGSGQYSQPPPGPTPK